MNNNTLYLAPRGFEHELEKELTNIVAHKGRLFIAKGGVQKTVWAQNIWLNPVEIPIASIGDGAKQLKAIQRNWWLHTVDNHRRAKLIQAKLPHVSAKRIEYGAPKPTAPLGSWTLWDANTIIAASRCTSPYPDGELNFVEDKETSPTRAYLKLWELFTVLERSPKEGELCLDLGSCPGGWTWVIANTGAHVFSVDKAEIDPSIGSLPNVNFCTGSAFGLDPRHAGKIDWLFSDVICYPERLYTLVERWLEHGECRNFACTIKFQADTDYETLEKFKQIPNSKIIHLSCNKHEVTWVKLEEWDKE